MTGIDATIGGQISIDIYDKGSDKSQVLKVIQDELYDAPINDYIFIGDRTMEGGNDYPLAQLMDTMDNCKSNQVEGWEDTLKVLQEYGD